MPNLNPTADYTITRGGICGVGTPLYIWELIKDILQLIDLIEFV